MQGLFCYPGSTQTDNKTLFAPLITVQSFLSLIILIIQPEIVKAVVQWNLYLYLYF